MARGAVASLIAVAVSGCTLITDIDREKIPNPPLPVFPEVDAGPQPDLDASIPHPPLGPDAAPPVDAGDGGAADGGALDAGLEDASAGS